MKRIFKVLSVALVLGLLVFTLASCSAEKKYEKYAEQIRVAEAKDEAISYADVIKKLGEPTENYTTEISFGSLEVKRSGSAYWYDGCADKDALDEKLEAGKEVVYIVVTFKDGFAIDAEVKVKIPQE